MREITRRSMVILTVVCAAGLLLMLVMLTGVSAPPEYDRAVAQRRWTALGINNYRMTVRIEYRGDTCFQQIEVRFQAPHALRNTCDLGWLGLMSVPELFDLAQQIEQIPPTRCYPSERWCICQRAFTVREVEYDADYGYPTLVLSRSALRPNWTGLDFWERLLQSTNLPSCGPAPRRLTVQVLALTNIP
jgi:hypothetical protein